MKKVIVITPGFPGNGARAVKLSKYLPGFGYEPIIITDKTKRDEIKDKVVARERPTVPGLGATQQADLPDDAVGGVTQSMGDVLSLIDKVQQNVEQKESATLTQNFLHLRHSAKLPQRRGAGFGRFHPHAEKPLRQQVQMGADFLVELKGGPGSDHWTGKDRSEGDDRIEPGPANP